MPSQENRVDDRSGPVSIPRLKQGEPSSGLLPAGDGLKQPVSMEPQEQELATARLPIVPPATGPVPAFVPGQLASTNLTRVLSATLPRNGDLTTSQRIPVVIKGTMKKPTRGPLSP